MSEFEARMKLIAAVKRKITSEWYAEDHPGDAHADDEANYCDDLIDLAAEDLCKTRGAILV